MFTRSVRNPKPAGLVACLVWLIAAAGSFGVETPFRFTSIGAREGLPNSSVAAIVQDSRGFLWFGTQNGLVRWDGYTFKLFENAPFVSDTLVHNQIQTLLLSGDTLWIGTYGGLNRFDLRTESFTAYRSDPKDPGSLSADLVISLCEDSAGRLWVGTSRGLDRLTEKGTFVHYRSIPGDPRSLGADLIRSVFEDSRGTLWVGTSGGGLARYQPVSDDFDVVRAGPGSSLPSDYVMSISESPSGELWFAFWYGGIARLADPESLRFEHVRLADDRTYFVDARRGDVVLAGSWGGGLFAYHPATGALERYRAADGPGSIAGDVVYSSLLDEDGAFWIGTNGNGVSRTERSDLRYEAYQHGDDPGSLAAGKASAILEDSRGRLWVGIYSGGLDRRDPGKTSFAHYRRDPRNP
ncbi:MAG TPA: two-component regulator propeller domain-containing protein, partial [Spirochaetia bacterium]|nr:two-component regulator propeller domain-containing protein [Spirochaetia bacterium]